MTLNPREVLKQTFGYEEIRQGQNEIISSIVDKRNVLAIMPTGAGKSLCYQIPAIINEKKKRKRKGKRKLTKKTKVIIPVHLFGLCCDILKLKRIIPKNVKLNMLFIFLLKKL